MMHQIMVAAYVNLHSLGWSLTKLEWKDICSLPEDDAGLYFTIFGGQLVKSFKNQEVP